MSKWNTAWDEDEDEYVPAENADRKMYFCCSNKCMTLFLRTGRNRHFWRGPGDIAKTCEKSWG